MAKALGHATWDPRLLDHYLPPAIQEFFTERWIRLFQLGILCEALIGSEHLLAATAFESMEQLDEFLEHHAFRKLPIHLEDPDAPEGQPTPPHRQEKRIVFGVDVGVLSILMSLENAVRLAPRLPCGRAIRWARISERLIPHLEKQTEQPEFHAVVHAARGRADAQLVAGLIYG
jgi:hypothetical protein